MSNDDHAEHKRDRACEGDPKTDPFMREYARRQASGLHRIEPAADVEPYELADEDFVDGPDLPGSTVVEPDLDSLIDHIAAELVLHAIACERTFGSFHLALSGGRTPVKLYERLMYDPDCRKIPWRRTHLWLVDEVAVPHDDPRSVFGLLQETIVRHSDIPREQVHPIAMNARDPASDYERTIRETLGWRERGHDRLDYVLLGLGADGSTAGLVPGSAAASERERLVAMVPESATAPRRVTMTIPLMNSARLVAIVASGESKAGAIARIERGAMRDDAMPVTAIVPVGGQLRWYLDWAATSRG